VWKKKAYIILAQATSVMILAASRIVFAIARDGALPLSDWLAKVSPDGLPRNAVTAIFILSAILLCTILPSMVAFTSILSAGNVQLLAAYGLIALLRLTMTPNEFQDSKFPLGRARKLMYVVSVVMNAIFFAVRSILACCASRVVEVLIVSGV
jgi:translation initiation factor 5B